METLLAVRLHLSLFSDVCHLRRIASVTHFHRVLESAAVPWLVLGWEEVARERIQSVNEDILILEHKGAHPPMPKPVSVKERFWLIPPGPVRDAARVMTLAAEKHDSSEGVGYATLSREELREKYFDKVNRHLDDWRSGKVMDDGPGGTGEASLSCALADLLILCWSENHR
jgi:hypothetical protein